MQRIDGAGLHDADHHTPPGDALLEQCSHIEIDARNRPNICKDLLAVIVEVPLISVQGIAGRTLNMTFIVTACGNDECADEDRARDGN
ncbi:hypothetical protein [Burkholderia cenocepacia]|uniref:hypothetical protein n=1 Tax=Burkholderia cenocepacia TaxID=95486 RepID=UPI0028588708|nr:hypothetical protein [Burkholderia cenocepacia]MDR8050296.1 hypothetical protein [Burkholderia cenocepacia]